MAILFISDTHLMSDDNSYDKNNKLQIQVINCIENYHKQHKLSALYLLGDIFNAWIGDEQMHNHILQPFILCLKQLHIKQCKIYFMHGNRDFLVSNYFAKNIPCIILSDPHIIYLDNKKILLTHGDLLCTNDVNYQRLRFVVRQKWLQKIFLTLPYFIRSNIAKYMRKLSTRKQLHADKFSHQNKTQISYSYKNIDINLQALQNWHNKYKFDVIIHGHTHKAGIYQYSNYQRLVLSDWNIKGGTCAIFAQHELNLKKFE